MKDYRKVFTKLVEETYIYLIKNRRKAMILGISGGIDSTVTAAICSEVNRVDNRLRFIGVSLPSSSNTNVEITAADFTKEAFCNESIEQRLDFESIRKSFSQPYEYLNIKETNISQGNIKARLRMMYLYNLASLTDGIVMDTDNLTEHYLGFWTIHGDVGDFNPIGGLWKHEIYELANYLADEYYPKQEFLSKKKKDDIANVLKVAINLMPTDGNGVMPGGDLAQIAPGLTYQNVDEVLMWFLDPKTNVKYYWEHLDNETWPQHIKQSYEELCEKFGKDKIEMIVTRHLNSEFKRKHLPLSISRDTYKEFII